ncbi:broad specificity phosphatase PhoE [Kushneria sinocarnis]|uniref:Broad specificity phosphatase PhoE n=1 Tax=Kushneria sinocarnis TaxID=595502 RepID=A0A420X1V2_9GAMM|nr:histidine phosphatase family protein [Kushneria sinocarnis]RKR07689.1 broad specificity phosphatase PhoE [Kushneria sinocarnis]
MTRRLTLIAPAATAAQRLGRLPADEPIELPTGARPPRIDGPQVAACFRAPELQARQTAEWLGFEATTEATLGNLDIGRWQGHSLESLAGEDPDGLARWLRDPAAAPHGGESIEQLCQRIAPWLTTLATGHTLMVTHSAVIRAFMLAAMEAPAHSYFGLDVAPLTLTRLEDSTRWRVRCSGVALDSSVKGS